MLSNIEAEKKLQEWTCQSINRMKQQKKKACLFDISVFVVLIAQLHKMLYRSIYGVCLLEIGEILEKRIMNHVRQGWLAGWLSHKHKKGKKQCPDVP